MYICTVGACVVYNTSMSTTHATEHYNAHTAYVHLHTTPYHNTPPNYTAQVM